MKCKYRYYYIDNYGPTEPSSKLDQRGLVTMKVFTYGNASPIEHLYSTRQRAQLSHNHACISSTKHRSAENGRHTSVCKLSMLYNAFRHTDNKDK